MKKKFDFGKFLGRVEQATVVRSVRSGLTNMIPILIIGAFSLIFQTFPIDSYQKFIQTALNGFLLQVFRMIYSATFGVLSVYMTIFISRAYLQSKAEPEIPVTGGMVTSVITFFVFSGAYLEGFGTDSLGPKSMFLAIVAAFGASFLYFYFSRFLLKKRSMLFSKGATREYNRMLSTLIPVAVVSVFFTLVNALVVRIFDVDSFRTLLARLFNAIFSIGKNGFFKGFFFVLLSSVLWFFGIHGSDTLEGVMQTYFAPGLTANQAAVEAGSLPNVVLTKEFFDCFVLMGGCGATICLLIAILIFSRNRAKRGLGYTASFSMLFNINELMVFGLPVIFNPVMLIPFLLVPLVCYSVSYLAISTGLVPFITSSVEWTTPIILGGFKATGSVRGAMLQVFNVIVGVLIYMPYVKLLDRETDRHAKQNYDRFMEYFKSNLDDMATIKLTERNDVYGDFAKGIAAELRHGLDKQIVMAYQPQYHYDGRIVGVEALLRWKHPVHGFLFPPLVVKLASELNILPDLEEAVFRRVFSEREEILAKFGSGVKISVNVTANTVVTPEFLQFLKDCNEKDPFAGKNYCIEVTEEAVIAFDEETVKALKNIREMGFLLAIDDFSMGKTSVHYMKDNLFDIIKLDGSLVKELFSHVNSREIVSSIVSLADSLNLKTLAEFVETPEQREALHEIGCDTYQGYLYSPAVFLSEHAK